MSKIPSLSIEQRRKLNGYVEPTTLADTKVLERQSIHKWAMKSLSKYISGLRIFFVFVGFAFVFMPAIVPSWREVIVEYSLLKLVFFDYARFRGLPLYHFYLMIPFYFVGSNIRKHVPGCSIKMKSYKDLLEMEIYPRNLKEELAFWYAFFYNFCISPAYIIIPFGFLGALKGVDNVPTSGFAHNEGLKFLLTEIFI